MWQHLSYALKFAKDLVIPPPPPSDLEQFSGACQDSLRILAERAVDEASTLQRHLGTIATTLDKFVADDSNPCFEFMIERETLMRFAEFASPDLPSEFIELLLPFFLVFLTTELSRHFDQVHVHSPLAILASRLNLLEQRAPRATRKFASELWRFCKRRPMGVELLRIHTSHAQEYPILDYFVDSVWLTRGSDIDFHPRKIILDIFAKTDLREPFGGYIEKKLFNKIVDFLVTAAAYAQTVQFPGKLSEMVQWCNDLAEVAQGFPIERIVATVKAEFSVFQKQLAMAFFLSSFTNLHVVGVVLDVVLEEEFLNELQASIEMPERVMSAIALLQTLLCRTRSREFVFPPVCGEPPVDILAVLPEQWQSAVPPPVVSARASEPSLVRRTVSGRIGRPGGRDARFYCSLLSLLLNFRELPYRLCLSLTYILTEYIRIGPDLVTQELESVCRTVIEGFGKIEALEKPEDSPELRAFVFAKFVNAAAA
jgi:hypothetical protein